MMTLYYAPGACSLATQIALNETGMDYQTVYIDLQGDRSEYYKVNPSGKVPALLVDDTLLSENVAILQWLADSHTKLNLLPSEPMARAQAMAFLAWCSSTAHLARRQGKHPKRFCDDPSTFEALAAKGKQMFWDCLVQIDQRLSDKKWILGDTYSMCDCYAIIFYDWGVGDGQPVGKLHYFSAYKQRMLARPAVSAALATHLSPLL